MERIFEIGDPEINVEEIMTRIRASIREKKERGLYTDEELRLVERLKLGDEASEQDYFKHTLNAADAMWRIEVDRYRLGIPPRLNRPVLAHMVIWSKEIIRRVLRFHTRATFYQQIEFNGHVVQILKGLHERMSQLESAASEIKTEIEKLKARRS